MRVRAATAADADAIGGIGARAWEATYRGIVPDPVLDEWIASTATGWRLAFEARAADSPVRIWVAERDGALLGYAATSPAKDEWLPPPEGAGELTSLYLEPDAIGVGTGRLLFDHAIEDLRERGFDPLLIWAFRDNPLARRFYDRVGLTVDVPDHDWVLGGVPCPIVRYRRDWASVDRLE